MTIPTILLTNQIEAGLEAITQDNGFFFNAEVIHGNENQPADMDQKPHPVLVLEVTNSDPVKKEPGRRSKSVKLKRSYYIQGFINVQADTRASDSLDELAHDIRRAIYPHEYVINGANVLWSETECRYLLPEPGINTAKLLMRLDFEILENLQELNP